MWRLAVFRFRLGPFPNWVLAELGKRSGLEKANQERRTVESVVSIRPSQRVKYHFHYSPKALPNFLATRIKGPLGWLHWEPGCIKSLELARRYTPVTDFESRPSSSECYLFLCLMFPSSITGVSWYNGIILYGKARGHKPNYFNSSDDNNCP